MVKKSNKVIEKGSGEGKLFEGSKFLDDVTYEFEISQEIKQSKSFSDTQLQRDRHSIK